MHPRPDQGALAAEPAPTLLVDRATGEIVSERVFRGDTLRFLYGTPLGRLLVDALLSRPAASHLYGWLERRGGPDRIRHFVDSLGVAADEAEHPLARYRTLDQFFARGLRPGARPVDPDPTHLVSPSDGRALAFSCAGDGALPMKGARVTLDVLLGDGALARAYEGGPALVIRLAPADYHRFHFPDSGLAGPPRRLGRRLHSVHPIALGAGAPSLLNKRDVSLLETERFGRLALVEVGALSVGTIEQRYRPGAVARGAEKGLFRFGGSTVVLLAERGRIVLDADLVASTARGLETLVRMGTRIGVCGA